MSEPTGHVQPPGKFEQAFVCGQMRKFSHVNPGIRKGFSAWAEEEAYRRLEESKTRLLPQAFLRREEFLLREINNGAYEWGFPDDQQLRAGMVEGDAIGPAIRNAMNTTRGQVKLTQLFLQEHHGILAAEQIAAMFAEKPERLQRVIQRCLDPNSASPLSDETTTGPDSTSANAATA